MASHNSHTNNTSADLEKIALAKFRTLAAFLPSECLISREKWGSTTALCLDFVRCPDLLEPARKQSLLLLLCAQSLGLAKAIIFRTDNKVAGWKSISITD